MSCDAYRHGASSNQPPLLSVVIPSYNCARYLPAALESVLAQSYQPLEVIVVDDGSTDDTPAVVARYPEVTCVRQANGGLSNARNTGIRKARGDWIALLDADDIWPPEKLREQMEILHAHPEIVLLFGDTRRFSDDGLTEPPMFERYGLTRRYFGHDYLVADAVPKLLRMNFIPVGTVLARKSVLIEAGLFDETFRRVEDWDMWLRVALRHPIAYSRKLWKLKRSHSTNLSNDTEAMAAAALAVMHKLENNSAAELAARGADIVRQLRNAYRNLGYFYLRQLRLRDARSALRQSLARGVQARALLYWCSSFLGRGLVGALVRTRG